MMNVLHVDMLGSTNDTQHPHVRLTCLSRLIKLPPVPGELITVPVSDKFEEHVLLARRRSARKLARHSLPC